MAVNPHNLDKYTRQAIETWSSTAKHDLGFEVLDRSTGKRYRYSLYEAGAATIRSGMPAGAYLPSANTVYTAGMVTDDASLSIGATGAGLIGVFRGVATATNKYGFIELAQKHLPTTVLTSSDNAVAQADLFTWDLDGLLTTKTPDSVKGDSSGLVASFVAIALDSHAASKDQAAAAITTLTPVTVRWL